MFKWIILILLTAHTALADTPPLRSVSAETYDYLGNGITSTLSGGMTGLDVHLVNEASDPALHSIIVGGAAIDPRARTWSLLDSTDSVSSVQSGVWTTARSWTLSSGSDSISASVSNFPATQAVTGTFFQATQPVSAASLPLPSGASTSANQATGNSSLSSIDTKTPALVTGRVPVDGSAVTQPVSAASLPLPNGAATAANQSTINTTLNTIDTDIKASQPRKLQDGAGVPILLDAGGNIGAVTRGNLFQNFTAATTSTIKSGAGHLSAVCLNSLNNSATITLYNNTSATGTQIGVFTSVVGGGAANSGCWRMDLEFNTGLTAVTTGTANWTVIYY